MSRRIVPVLAVAVLAATLWVVPSIGSQGMGTIGERYIHADRGLIGDVSGAEPARLALQRADAAVEAALGR